MSELKDMDKMLKAERKQRGKLLADVCKDDECCCKCKHQFIACICNCGDEWPADVMLSKSKINEKHGHIGWACMVFISEGVVEVMRHKHSLCECFDKRIDTDKEDTHD